MLQELAKKKEILFNIDDLTEGKYRVRGSKMLTMTEFGVEPPSVFFGLIKAHDSIEVYFDLYVLAQKEIINQIKEEN